MFCFVMLPHFSVAFADYVVADFVQFVCFVLKCWHIFYIAFADYVVFPAAVAVCGYPVD
jgi:hypothetical protein